MHKLKLTALALLVISASAFAQDRYFARTYTTNILPKGAIDIEFWHTSRIGHSGQFFHAQDQRMELEFGLGKNLQTAFYFNRYQKRFSESADGTAVSNEIGFSNEWKWKLSDPSANKIGFALYGEWGLKGGDELELETKLIFDKIINKNIFALNIVYEYEKEFEWEKGKVKSDSWEQPVEFDLAYQYLIRPSFGLGFEIRNHNEIAKDNGWEHSVFFGGPTLNLRKGKWFAIVNYLPQWGNVHKTEFAPYSKVLDEHERTEARIIVGISL
ncbi:MAG: hypothetical protein KF741_13230 [Ferruginibacter sp.]|nr:hypothetical protein [Bacteroidota bacterium]MBX2920200.1 hypothetical protein [Ferruginibacter sp.]